MKLCMSILADRLSSYSQQSLINDDIHDIVGVRFYAGRLPECAAGYVYVGHASDVFEDSQFKDAVLLASGHDMIIIEGQTLETVVNDVLMTFDLFNAWEAALHEAALQEDCYQRMLDLSVDLFGGMLGIANIDGRVLAYSFIEEPTASDTGWDYVMKNQTVPIAMINTPIITADDERVSDLTSNPTLYKFDDGKRYISCFFEMDGEQVATIYIQEKHKVFTGAYLRMAETLCAAIEQSILAKKHPDIRSQTSIFIDLIKGSPVDGEILDRLGTRSGLDRNIQESWVVVVLKNLSIRNAISQTHLVRVLQEIGVANHPFNYDEGTVTIVGTHDLGALIAELQNHTPLDRYAVGVSMPFSSWDRLQSRYRQSLFAIEWNEGMAGVFASQDYAFAYILRQVAQFNENLELSHPALERLRLYDKKNGTELYRTLSVFLKNERNVVATSKELFIHRNTLMSRISRIAILTGLRLDDHDERVYLEFSYLLAKEAGF